MQKSLLLLTLICCFVLNKSFSQETRETKEITNTDITVYPGPQWDKVSVFGIKVGMSQDAANQILSENKQLYYYEDKNHTTKDYRIYVYDRDAAMDKKNCILYLIWRKNAVELSRITFFEDFEPYLQGKTKSLLTPAPFSKDSWISKNCLGNPDEQKVTLDIPSIKTKHTTNFYKSRGIQVTLKVNGEEKTAVFAIYNPAVAEN